jgi:hypothetical protein
VQRGLRIVSGRTESHVMLVDLRSKGITGKEAEAVLGDAHMTINKNAIPTTREADGDQRRAAGHPAMTTRGFKEEEARITGQPGGRRAGKPRDAANIARVREKVNALTRRFPSTSKPPMKCPFCSIAETQVVETRMAEDGDFIRRRRQCAHCEKRFTTYERPDVNFPRSSRRTAAASTTSAPSCWLLQPGAAQAPGEHRADRQRRGAHRGKAAEPGRARVPARASANW